MITYRDMQYRNTIQYNIYIYITAVMGGIGQKTVPTICELCTYEFDTDHSKQYYLRKKMQG